MFSTIYNSNLFKSDIIANCFKIINKSIKKKYMCVCIFNDYNLKFVSIFCMCPGRIVFYIYVDNLHFSLSFIYIQINCIQLSFNFNASKRFGYPCGITGSSSSANHSRYDICRALIYISITLFPHYNKFPRKPNTILFNGHKSVSVFPGPLPVYNN